MSEQGVAMSIATISVCRDENEISGHRYVAMAIAEATIDKTMKAAMLRRQDEMSRRIDSGEFNADFFALGTFQCWKVGNFCTLFVKSYKV